MVVFDGDESHGRIREKSEKISLNKSKFYHHPFITPGTWMSQEVSKWLVSGL